MVRTRLLFLALCSSFDAFDALYVAELVHQGVECVGILYVDAQNTLENAVVTTDGYLAYIDAEIVRYDMCNLQQQPHTVDASQLDGREVRDRFVLRPFDLVFNDILAEERCQSVQFVAG